MVIEIYWDELLLLHFLLNFFALKIADESMYGILDWKRAMKGGLVGAVSFLALLILPLPRILHLLLLCFCPMYLAAAWTFQSFVGRGLWRVLKNAFFFAALLGSILVGLKRITKGFSGFRGSLVTVVFGTVLYFILHTAAGKDSEERTVQAELFRPDGSCLRLTAIRDTGNFLTEPVSKKPVCVLSERCLEELYREGKPEFYRVIPYQTVNGQKGYLKGYLQPMIRVRLDGLTKTLYRVYLAAEETEHTKEGSDNFQMIMPERLLR